MSGKAWYLVWAGLLIGLLGLDYFVIKSPEGVARPVVSLPEQADAVGGELEISWLGPPYFAGAKEGTWIERQLEARYEIRLRPYLMDSNGYARKKPLMIAGGEVPDMIWEADPAGLQKAVEHRFIAEVPYKLIAAHMPTYLREVTDNAPTAWLYSHYAGGNFGIPTYSRTGAYPVPGLWRRDWLEAVGIAKVPETLEEMREALYRFRHADPDGNGRKDTYGMSGDISNWWWASFSEIYGAHGVLPFDWQLEDGEVVYGGIREATREALAVLRAWYADEIIHPDFVTDSMLGGQSLDRKFLGGTVGYAYYRGNYQGVQFTGANSFAFQFLSLQLPAVIENRADLARTLVDILPRAVADSVFAGWLLEALESGEAQLLERVSAAAAGYAPHLGLTAEAVAAQARETGQAALAARADWLVMRGFRRPFASGKDIDLTDNYVLKIGETLGEKPLAEQMAGLINLGALEVVQELRRERLNAGAVAALTARIAEELGAWRAQLGERAGREAFADWAFSAQSAGFVDSALAAAVELGIAPELAPDLAETVGAYLLGYYGFLMTEQVLPRILEPGAFPVGPEGYRGARVWGMAGNILTFGGHVAQTPEKAVRVMGMLESLYTDREWSFYSTAGMEGEHWDWVDPVLGREGGLGMTMRRQYADPDSGQVINLQDGQVGLRKMLLPKMGFFNLLGMADAHADYYDAVNSLSFRETYQRVEWGIENVLGKSDAVPSAATYLADLRHRQQTVFAEIIRGSRPLSAFDDWVAHWHSRGGDILTAEANALYRQRQQIIEEIRSYLEAE